MNSTQVSIANEVANAALADLQDEKIYGDIGKPFNPYPLYPLTPDITQEMQWKWFPSFRIADLKRYFSVERILTFGVVFFSFVSAFFFFLASVKGLVGNNTGEIAGGVIFLIVAFCFLYCRIIIGSHKARRKETCIALARRNQALELWRNNPGPDYEAKDEYFKNRYFRVLRNGTVEAITADGTPTDASNIIDEFSNVNKLVNDTQSVMLDIGGTENQETDG